MVSFMHEQNIICSQTQSQTQLEDIVHDQTIIWRELFPGQVVGSQPMKRKKNLHRIDKTCYCDREKGILERYISKVTV